MLRKWMSALLALCLVLGCAGSILAEDAWFPLSEEPFTLKIVGRQTTNQIDFGEMLVFQKYEALTNVHIEWTMVPSDAFTERRNLMFATNDLPDAIWRSNLNLIDTAKYAAEGQLLAINDYLAECPNLTDFYARNPNVVSSITMADGKIYGTGYYYEHPALRIGQRLFFNEVWRANLGLELPTTTDELVDYLRAIRDNDANGDGDPNDEIPLVLSDGRVPNLVSVLNGAWGLANRGPRVEFTDVYPGTDDLRFWPADDNYRGVLEYIKLLYDEKLLDNECFTITYENFVALGTTNKVGVFPYVNVTLMGERGDDYAGLPVALIGPNGDQLHTAVNAVVGSPTTFVMCPNNPDPQLTMKWIDYFYGEAGNELLFLVERGLLYDTDENGRNYGLPYLTHNPDGLTTSQVFGKYTPWSGGGNPALIMDNYFIGGEAFPIPFNAAKALEPYMPDVIWESFSYTEAESEILSTLQADLRTYIDEMRANFITGRSSLETEWDAYVNELKKIGMEQYIEIQNAAYGRYKGV